jgi:hypothetical protein
MDESGTLGVERVCCLLHNLLPGGSARQWLHLLSGHVQAGGGATIIAPPGPLSVAAGTAGIELVEIDWDDEPPHGDDALWHVVAGHDAAIVHWDHRVMNAFAPALTACGRALLTVHQTPDALARWFGPEIVPATRAPLIRAVNDRHAGVLVRGESHRSRVATAFDLPAESLDILPASIPLAAIPFQPRAGQPTELLALIRLSPDKAAVGQLAVALARSRLAAGNPCQLAIAGDGLGKSRRKHSASASCRPARGGSRPPPRIRSPASPKPIWSSLRASPRSRPRRSAGRSSSPGRSTRAAPPVWC